jgi:hypothetical protein
MRGRAAPHTAPGPAWGRAQAAKPCAQAARVVAQALAQASGSVLLEAWAGEEAADGAADSRDDVAARVAEVRACGSKMRPPLKGDPLAEATWPLGALSSDVCCACRAETEVRVLVP